VSRSGTSSGGGGTNAALQGTMELEQHIHGDVIAGADLGDRAVHGVDVAGNLFGSDFEALDARRGTDSARSKRRASASVSARADASMSSLLITASASVTAVPGAVWDECPRGQIA
jgi:hypothetical protein